MIFDMKKWLWQWVQHWFWLRAVAAAKKHRRQQLLQQTVVKQVRLN